MSGFTKIRLSQENCKLNNIQNSNIKCSFILTSRRFEPQLPLIIWLKRHSESDAFTRHETFLFFSRFPIFSRQKKFIISMNRPFRFYRGEGVRSWSLDASSTTWEASTMFVRSMCVFRDVTVDGRNTEQSMTMFTYYRLFH